MRLKTQLPECGIATCQHVLWAVCGVWSEDPIARVRDCNTVILDIPRSRYYCLKTQLPECGIATCVISPSWYTLSPSLKTQLPECGIATIVFAEGIYSLSAGLKTQLPECGIGTLPHVAFKPRSRTF